MYKLFCIDLDGTLLNDKCKISKENIEAINYAKNRGFKICINTGRNYYSSIDYCKQINADYLIYLQGCFIFDLNNNKYIRNKIISFLYFLLYYMFPYKFIGNKYYGLKKLCKHLSIKLKEVISIGNDSSDLTMLNKSGLGICMINSDWVLKYNVNHITNFDNNNSGVADTIYEILK